MFDEGSCGDVAGRLVHDHTTSRFSFCFLERRGANDVLGAEVVDGAMLVRYKEGDSSMMTRSKRVRSATNWATDVDVVALATELDLGFIVAGNNWDPNVRCSRLW